MSPTGPNSIKLFHFAHMVGEQWPPTEDGPGLSTGLTWAKSPARGTIPQSYWVIGKRDAGGLLPSACPWGFLPLQRKASPSET